MKLSKAQKVGEHAFGASETGLIRSDFKTVTGVLDGLRTTVLVCDDQKIFYVNAAGQDFFTGIGIENIFDHNLFELFDSTYSALAEIGLAELSHEATPVPVLLPSQQSGPVDCELSVTAMTGLGVGSLFQVELRDISGHMKAARGLRDREHRLEEIIDTVADGIITVNQEGLITTFNAASEQIFLTSKDQVLGKSLFDLVPAFPRDPQKFDGVDIEFHELLVTLSNGETVLAEFAGRPRPQAHGQTLTWVVRDITQSKHQEELNRQLLFDAEMARLQTEEHAAELVSLAEEYYELKKQAEVSDRVKSDFLANMSHELRTPLNAVIGFSEIIKSEIFGPVGAHKYLEYANDIHASGSHLLSLINDILDLSKIEAGAQKIYEEEFCLRSLIRESTDIVRERAARIGVRIVVEIAEDFPKMIADRIRIKQILLNLLTNAIKFSTPDRPINILAVTTEDGGIVLRVKDQGQGIAESEIDKVLQPFGQATDSMTSTQEGTGLGLPLCVKLMELHDGQFRLESELGVGTTVTLTFGPERTTENASIA